MWPAKLLETTEIFPILMLHKISTFIGNLLPHQLGDTKVFKASKTLPTCMKCPSASASVPVHRTGYLEKIVAGSFVLYKILWLCVENFTFEKALSCLHTGEIVWKWARLRMLDGRVIARSSDGTLSLILNSLVTNGPLCVTANLHVCDSLGKLSKNVPL